MTADKSNKSNKPSVATYADHEVISPPNKLRMAVSVVAPQELDDDPVARAELALLQLSGEFSAWMRSECDRLDLARNEVTAKGFNKITRDALFHAAHDIKGAAATFGFPGVAAPADSLCRLIEHTPDVTRIPVALVNQHVDAVRAIIRENTRPDVAAIADALTQRLRQVTDEFLAHANRERPDYLKGVLAPPIVPADQSF
jgi:HPt (histidine-containing phosphotransfer) domain-containing protein